ncbi:MAG TPA: BPTI/Kunitz-type proteinase inhibitor domain-containing protein [Polyangiaceae bacterium]|nr:BPTI/Kunitz-type proteinase inhibitor domain-containing protein [Polyangiaceae bacterium]
MMRSAIACGLAITLVSLAGCGGRATRDVDGAGAASGGSGDGGDGPQGASSAGGDAAGSNASQGGDGAAGSISTGGRATGGAGTGASGAAGAGGTGTGGSPLGGGTGGPAAGGAAGEGAASGGSAATGAVGNGGVGSICDLPLDQGICDSGVQIFAYYYNSSTRRCEQFIYCGDGGNENRFDSVEHCRRTCFGFAPALCALPVEATDCEDYPGDYYFDAQTGRCEKYAWPLCARNDNRFDTEEACLWTCGNGTPSVCPVWMASGAACATPGAMCTYDSLSGCPCASPTPSGSPCITVPDCDTAIGGVPGDEPARLPDDPARADLISPTQVCTCQDNWTCGLYY